MEFYVHLIYVDKEQSHKANQFLSGNCKYIVNNHWFYEGELFCLDEAGVSYITLGEESVPSLGGLSESELIEVCKERFYVTPKLKGQPAPR
jgi:hypothetical protein